MIRQTIRRTSSLLRPNTSTSNNDGRRGLLCDASINRNKKTNVIHTKLLDTKDGPTLSQFLPSNSITAQSRRDSDVGLGPTPLSAIIPSHECENTSAATIPEWKMKFHLKTFGCQMNVNDSDIVRSILLDYHKKPLDINSFPLIFEETESEYEADICLINTCAIRENAETKVWHRLKYLQSLFKKSPGTKTTTKRRIMGVLGCMAERLKEDIFKNGTADLIVGPDAYRELPHLIRSLVPGPDDASTVNVMDRAVNVQLSFDEMYTDVTPVRKDNNISAFVSVMRGCNNMCSYCVVPFTRGRERSRSLTSVVEEVSKLVQEGVKEVVLLGQNVNSYHDSSNSQSNTRYVYRTSHDGFSNIYKRRGGPGYYFADLLEAISDISPELRVRFTSPHPKDYPPELLSIMAERANVCKHLHMPAQSGSSSVLTRMRRGYTRDAYLRLVDDARSVVPDVALSSDFITGFCGETEQEHGETLSLMEYIKFDSAYMFAYSMRGKTHAHRTMVDDVDADVKSRRLQEVIGMFRTNVQRRNDEVEVGKWRLVLVEGKSRKSNKEKISWAGRTDQNKRIVFPVDVGDSGHGYPMCYSEDDIRGFLLPGMAKNHNVNIASSLFDVCDDLLINKERKTHIISPKVPLKVGDYALVKVIQARGHTLRGELLFQTSLTGFAQLMMKMGSDVSSTLT